MTPTTVAVHRKAMLSLLLITLSAMALYTGTTRSPSTTPPDVSRRHEDNEDLRRFRRILRFQQDAGKPRAVIYYLVRVGRFSELRKSVASLSASFNGRYGYPIVVFYDEAELENNGGGGASSSSVSSAPSRLRDILVSDGANSSLMFLRKIRFELPPFINASAVRTTSGGGGGGGFPLNYRHMCRFHALSVYGEPMLADGVDYALRLDHDSVFLRPVPYDIFDRMRRRRLDYGFLMTLDEEPAYLGGLREAIDGYVRASSVVPQPGFRDWRWPLVYYNNFELSALRLWRSAEYAAFVDHLDRLGGIYYHRWGDAPIKTAAVKLFVPPDRIQRFGDIAYRHKQLTTAG